MHNLDDAYPLSALRLSSAQISSVRSFVKARPLNRSPGAFLLQCFLRFQRWYRVEDAVPNELRILVALCRDKNPGLDEIRARALRLEISTGDGVCGPCADDHVRGI